MVIYNVEIRTFNKVLKESQSCIVQGYDLTGTKLVNLS